MNGFARPYFPFRPSLALILLWILLATLWFAGGASRADAPGQAVVRGVSWVLFIIALLFGERPRFSEARPVWIFLLAAIALSLLQLVPLPPAIWQALPGRAMFAEAAAATGDTQPWRPLAIVPSAALNAASSLIVPAVTLMLTAALRPEEKRSLPGLLLCSAACSLLVALTQFSGAGVDNPLVNDVNGQVSGTFANRNHLALFLAIGCLVAPAWVFLGGRQLGWRVPVALGLLLLFALMILATGSRAGLILGALALAIGGLLPWAEIRRELRRAPRWVTPLLTAAIFGTVILFIVISIEANRAVSIYRALAVDPGRDMRTRGLPTVLMMIRTYFPAGSGFGGFDTLFRLHEPFSLLKLTYFNHAHDDFLEIVLDGGAPSLLLLLAAITWWGFASVRAWRGRKSSGMQSPLPRLGSAILLLVFIASAFDYPARTPMIMSVIAIAAMWLSAPKPARSALPENDQPL